MILLAARAGARRRRRPVDRADPGRPGAALPADGDRAGRRSGRDADVRRPGRKTFRVHVELFAQRKVVVVPPGIGVAGNGCVYPARTSTPTGVVEVERGAKLRLGDLFRIWGRRLGEHRLLTFPSSSRCGRTSRASATTARPPRSR